MLDRLMSSEWSLVVIEGNRFVKHAGDGSFRATGTLNRNDQVPSVRWNLNNTGDDIQLALHNGNAYICEIFIHSHPRVYFEQLF
jgi:hypothetical protein